MNSSEFNVFLWEFGNCVVLWLLKRSQDISMTIGCYSSSRASFMVHAYI